MKRLGRIPERAATLENLQQAFLLASRGKRWRPAVVDFRNHLDSRLAGLKERLLDGSMEFGQYRAFVIKDPKERVIHAAPFEQQVVHHALMLVCEPVFERLAVDRTYACRPGRGQLVAVRQAAEDARHTTHFLKMDVRKYFDSIDHRVLHRQLMRRFKGGVFERLMCRLIGSYHTLPGRGLPIGNLTSQHFANYYLRVLDCHAMGPWGCRRYLRYMDDFVIFEDSRARLKRLRLEVSELLQNTLGLELKPNWFIQRTHHGMDFLGYRIFPGWFRLSRKSCRRFERKCSQIMKDQDQGMLGQLDAQQRLTSLTAWTLHARSYHQRGRALARLSGWNTPRALTA